MFDLIGVLLAVVGVVAVVGAAALFFSMWLEDKEPARPDPYREGLDATARISALAWEAEQAMYRASWQEHNE